MNDGGPAFPVAWLSGSTECKSFGMSLRDYFAAAALPWALETNSGNAKTIIKSLGINPLTCTEEENKRLCGAMLKNVADVVYKVADAMIAEREKK